MHQASQANSYFYQACPAYQPYIFSAALITLTIATTKTPLDIVLQHTPAVTAHSGGTEQRSKRTHFNLHQFSQRWPTTPKFISQYIAYHGLSQNRKLSPIATTTVARIVLAQTQSSSPIDTCNTVPQQPTNIKLQVTTNTWDKIIPDHGFNSSLPASRLLIQNSQRTFNTQHQFSSSNTKLGTTMANSWHTSTRLVPVPPNHFFIHCQRSSSGSALIQN